MSTETKPADAKREGFAIEHIILTVTIVHDREIGQFDDSCAYHVRNELLQYVGIKVVEAAPLYNNCRIDRHVDGCDCHFCAMATLKKLETQNK